MEELRSVEVDLVRAWLGGFVVVPKELPEKELVEALRKWRDVTMGGLDRSFFTGSGSVAVAGGFGRRFDVDLCSPLVVVGLLMFARREGGRVEAVLEMLPVALGGRTAVVDMLRDVRVVGFTGNRLGD